MKKFILSGILFYLAFISGFHGNAQWIAVAENVTPVKLAISPDYHHDQTAYMVDDAIKLMISETGGSTWVKLYEASEPWNTSQAILDIVISPNFKNDNALIMIHKDGNARLSFDRGQHWVNLPVPDGTSGVVFSPKVAEDYRLFCVTGAYGPVVFYKSIDGGANWLPMANILLGGGFYSRLWNSTDTAAINYFAIQTDSKSLYLSGNGGLEWIKSFEAQGSLQDFTYSPNFSQDHTIFIAGASDIWKNINGGAESDWIKTSSFTGSIGIKLAISPTFTQDQTLFAAVDQAGIVRSIDGGGSFTDFSDGFPSTLPISISISQVQPAVLFAGTQGEGGGPGSLYKYQTTLGLQDEEPIQINTLHSYPNPFSNKTEITFELDESGHVDLSVYEMNGKKITVLKDEYMPMGVHSINFNPEPGTLKPGIYFCRMSSKNQNYTLKLMVF